ncbi:Potassium transporter 5-like protein [Drosera capensis]
MAGGAESERNGGFWVGKRPPFGNQSAVEIDSLNLEAGRASHPQSHKTKIDWRTFSLAFQSIGVIYGDLGTSPLYVFQSTFPDGINDPDDVLGALSVIIYTIILLPLIKYVFIILWANDNGNGAEAMFADLGHFNVQAVQISFSTMVFLPTLIAYIGQAAFLRKNPDKMSNVFFNSIAGLLYWPTFFIAVPSAIIASQAIVSAAFAIISQSLTLGCFPRVNVCHTSSKYEGQVCIPETTEKISNALGFAVCSVMVVTTCMITLIMLVVWKTSIWKIVLFFVFGVIELHGRRLSSAALLCGANDNHDDMALCAP